ncbi:MAG: hypothetical protein QOG49_1882 [Frankiaceae bacterium]|nr:hypothetical protein [Frankiaceae bacterium]
MLEVAPEIERILRPAAILKSHAAALIITALERCVVSGGGVWNASTSLWQRYDRPWDGFAGGRGTAELVGSIAIVHDSPVRNEITIYKVTLAETALAAGWTVERLCDDALAWVGLTLASCPRATMAAPPPPDPFRARQAAMAS